MDTSFFPPTLLCETIWVYSLFPLKISQCSLFSLYTTLWGGGSLIFLLSPLRIPFCLTSVMDWIWVWSWKYVRYIMGFNAFLVERMNKNNNFNRHNKVYSIKIRSVQWSVWYWKMFIQSALSQGAPFYLKQLAFCPINCSLGQLCM